MPLARSPWFPCLRVSPLPAGAECPPPWGIMWAGQNPRPAQRRGIPRRLRRRRPPRIMTPVPRLAAPLASYNVLFTRGLAAGPLCAFPLLRRFTGNVPAAGLGALVFGFSPAVLASGFGHVNLALTAPMTISLLL